MSHWHCAAGGFPLKCLKTVCPIIYVFIRHVRWRGVYRKSVLTEELSGPHETPQPVQYTHTHTYSHRQTDTHTKNIHIDIHTHTKNIHRQYTNTNNIYLLSVMVAVTYKKHTHIRHTHTKKTYTDNTLTQKHLLVVRHGCCDIQKTYTHTHTTYTHTKNIHTQYTNTNNVYLLSVMVAVVTCD